MLAPGIVEAFRLQGDFCGKFGSPLYAALLARCADDLEAGGPVARVLDGWVGNPLPEAVMLRLLGAVHLRVLQGLEPELARFYPSAGGAPQWPAIWDAFHAVVERQTAALRRALERHVQTNEVRRSGALLGGFLTIAAAHGLPLRLLEIGSSAGLNLHWDRYRYDVELPDGTLRSVWGDARSAVTIRTAWQGPLDVFATAAHVAERLGCDVSPVDVSDPAQAMVLESFVWPDQLQRIEQLRNAVALARRQPCSVRRQRAADFLADQLAAPRSGVATVVFHSIMWWYLSEDERTRVSALIREAGARATDGAPLAWLRLELMTSSDPDLLLTSWPGGTEVRLARGDAHGRSAHWLT